MRQSDDKSLKTAYTARRFRHLRLKTTLDKVSGPLAQLVRAYDS